ncbi:hypothetical protein SEA_ESTES_97 [Mycobacterium phage Estes]|uniref:Uncharacterized protein n=1 Tax=Mycobacterium phage Estes TaxID=2759459 RepID=A0A7G9A2G7_9CAUD|nr:hypothetical protein J4U03_gp097 [Mycobacterium phage Estes]QNL30806.1 hypothetical protein SEA_ESTES_97 [Mycobacterium phage Estes]
MSLIMPMMIGHQTIGSIVISRLEKLSDKDTYLYEWEVFMKEGRTLRGDRPQEYHTGTVEHDYDDGAVKLIQKVMEKIP